MSLAQPMIVGWPAVATFLPLQCSGAGRLSCCSCGCAACAVLLHSHCWDACQADGSWVVRTAEVCPSSLLMDDQCLVLWGFCVPKLPASSQHRHKHWTVCWPFITLQQPWAPAFRASTGASEFPVGLRHTAMACSADWGAAGGQPQDSNHMNRQARVIWADRPLQRDLCACPGVLKRAQG